MMIKPVTSLKGEINIPGDKSISHRAVMFGSISDGLTEVTNFLEGADCLSTISCFQSLGIPIQKNRDTILIHGKGLHGLSAPLQVLDAGNSGTTTRLISGILAGQSFESTLTGDASIQKRPMKRIIEPLTLMDANITSMNGNGCAPLHIAGKSLKGIHYISPVASAQVKSCVLLAGLYADSATSVTEPALSRNHTELMLSSFGAKIETNHLTATIHPNPVLKGQKIEIPGDISSAAYFIAAACLIPNSEIRIKNVGINPSRDGILKVAQAMGASIQYQNPRISSGEKVCDLLVSSCSLHGTIIEGDIIPTLIDELPIIAVMAAFATGTTIIKDAEELKVKESNRIESVTNNLKAMGCDITATDDGFIIVGGHQLHGTVLDSHQDHRIAMSFTIAAMGSTGTSEILNSECVNISYPTFYHDIFSLSK